MSIPAAAQTPTSPTLSSLMPVSGPATGGTTVTITGSGFVAGAMVSFGTTPSPSTTVLSPTVIRTITPPQPQPGFVDIAVRNPDGSTARKTRAFQYLCVAPAILEQPQNMTINAGATATLTVRAEGSGLTYEWYEGVRGDFSRPTQTRTPSFTTPALANTTSYWVRVSNNCASTDSATAVITVMGSTVRRPFVVVSDRPAALIQRADQAGAEDSFTLTNVGDDPSTITLAQNGDFFTQSPTQFVLQPRRSQVVRLTGLARAAGGYEGASLIMGDGVPSGFSIPIRLLSVQAPAGNPDVRPGRARVEVQGRSGENPVGVMAFVNVGNAPAVGFAVADAPWIQPQPGIIIINPGEVKPIPFTIDRARRADAQALQGSAKGKMSFRYLRGGGSSSRLETTQSSGSSTTATISISVVDVVTPQVTAATPPALAAGEVAKFLPGLVQRSGISTDVLLSTTTSSAVSDLKIFYSTGAQTLLNSIASLNLGSVLSLGGAVSSIFGTSNASGTGQVRSTSADAISVSTVQGSYDSGDGSYTTAVPVFRSDRSIAAGQSMMLPGALKSSVVRTDLYVQEVSGNAGNVRIEVLDANGAVISSRNNESIAAFGQIEVQDAVPSGDSTIRISNTSSSAAAISAFAMARDLVTSDAWVVADWANLFGGSAGQRLIIPVSSLGRDQSSNTRIFLSNPGASNLTATLSLVGAPAAPARRRAVRSGSDSEGGNAVQSVTLAPMQTLAIDQALAAVGVTATSTGYVVLESSAPVSMGGRTIKGTGLFNASFGTGLPVFPASYGFQTGQRHRFSGVDDASQRSIDNGTPSTYRSSLMFLETNGQPATVRVTLSYSFAASERVTATGVQSSKEFSIAANQITTISNLALSVIGDERLNYGDLRDMQVDVEFLSGEGRVIPLLESIDNRSGDVILRTE